MKSILYILISFLFISTSKQQDLLLSNFFNGTHQIVIYQDLSVKFVQLVTASNTFTTRPRSYEFTNGTHFLRIDENGKTTITSLIQTTPILTGTTRITTRSIQNTKPIIFSVTNGTHLITVYQDLTLNVVPIYNNNQNQNTPVDTTSQMIFCIGQNELGLYGDGRIVRAPLFSLWQPPTYPFYFQQYVINSFFNGTHTVTVYNDGRMQASPVYYSFIPFGYYYTANLLRNQINNGTHNMKIYNSGRVDFFRLV